MHLEGSWTFSFNFEHEFFTFSIVNCSPMQHGNILVIWLSDVESLALDNFLTAIENPILGGLFRVNSRFSYPRSDFWLQKSNNPPLQYPTLSSRARRPFFTLLKRLKCKAQKEAVYWQYEQLFFLDVEKLCIVHSFCRHDIFTLEVFHYCAHPRTSVNRLIFYEVLLFDNLFLTQASFLGLEFFEQFSGGNGLDG